jgi:hypothetical protein
MEEVLIRVSPLSSDQIAKGSGWMGCRWIKNQNSIYSQCFLILGRKSKLRISEQRSGEGQQQ